MEQRPLGGCLGSALLGCLILNEHLQFSLWEARLLLSHKQAHQGAPCHILCLKAKAIFISFPFINHNLPPDWTDCKTN